MKGPVSDPRTDTVPSITRNFAVYFGNGYEQGPAMERQAARLPAKTDGGWPVWLGWARPRQQRLIIISGTGRHGGLAMVRRVACGCLAACFPWSLAGLSRWPLLNARRGGATHQCHDDDDERGARDSDLLSRGRGAWSGPAGHRPCVRVCVCVWWPPTSRHVLNISRMSAVVAICHDTH